MNKVKKLLNSNGMSGLISSLISIGIGLIVGFIVLTVCNPSQAGNGIRTLLLGGFTGGIKGIGNVLYYATPIIMTGLGVGLAFKASLFNIGGSGQFIVGAYFALYVAIKMDFPGPLGWIMPIIAGAVGGALWALIPGIVHAYLKVNIVIVTIMMNYIGMYTVNYFIKLTIYDTMKGQTQVIPKGHTLPSAGLDKIFGNSMVNIGFLIAVALAIIVYICLEKTTFGFELKAVGKNRDASRYAGISEKRTIITTMMISGALIGIGGALLYLSASGKYIKVTDVLSPEGFNGIAVTLLALNNPIGIIFTAIFIAYMNVSGFYMQSFRFSPEIVNVIISVIIYFSAFSLIIKQIINKLKLRKEVNDTEKVKGGQKE